MNPDLQIDDYTSWDTKFLNNSTFVCEDCYLKITASSACSGINKRPLSMKPMKGTGDLMPEITSKKRELMEEEERLEREFEAMKPKIRKKGKKRL